MQLAQAWLGGGRGNGAGGPAEGSGGSAELALLVGSDDEDGTASGDESDEDEEEGANAGEAVIDLAAHEDAQRPRGTRGRDTCAAAPFSSCILVPLCMWLPHAQPLGKVERSFCGDGPPCISSLRSLPSQAGIGHAMLDLVGHACPEVGGLH